MSEGTLVSPITDRSLFSMHPEDWVTQQDSHDEQTIYLKHALRGLLPHCYVARDMAVYWVPGRFQDPYVGPDIFVSRHQPRVPDPKSWVVYEDGPLVLVIEVASDTTRTQELTKRDEKYADQLQVPEYVSIDLYRDELRLERLVAGRYESVPPDSQGRLWSPELGIGFFRPADERLVRVISADGEIVPTAQEEAALRREEAALRREEAALRRAAEARADALAAELERLRRLVEEGHGQAGGSGSTEGSSAP